MRIAKAKVIERDVMVIYLQEFAVIKIVDAVIYNTRYT